MMKNHKDCGKCTHVLMALSVIALVLATIVSLFQVDLWLAGTQWILISILLAIYALIGKIGHSGSSCCSSDKSE